MNQFGNPINPINPYMNMVNPYINRPIQQNNGIIWVQGIEGAKAYQIPQNSNAVLLDSEREGIFYIKTSDNIGMCNLRVFQYSEMTEQPVQNTPNVDMSQYVTKDELNAILSELGGNANGKQSVSTTKSAKSADSK